MLVFFTNSSHIEFQVGYLALFQLFSVKDGFEWFWMGRLHWNIQLMLEILNVPFLVLHLFYCTWMTHLLMLSDNFNIAIYADDIVLCSNFAQVSDLWQQLELASELQTDLRDTRAGIGLLISVLEKLNLFCMTGLKYLVLLLLKWVVLFSKKIHLLPCWDYLYPLNRIGPLILSVLLKLPPRKLKLWIVLWSFFLLRFLFISWIFHTVLYRILLSVWAGAPSLLAAT